MFYCGLDFAMKSSYVYITDSQGRKKPAAKWRPARRPSPGGCGRICGSCQPLRLHRLP
jgi:hypothetical protein